MKDSSPSKRNNYINGQSRARLAGAKHDRAICHQHINWKSSSRRPIRCRQSIPHFFQRKNNHVGNLELLFFLHFVFDWKWFAGKRVVTDVIMCAGMCELVFCLRVHVCAWRGNERDSEREWERERRLENIECVSRSCLLGHVCVCVCGGGEVESV